MRAAQDCVARHLRWQRDRSRHFRSGALCRVDDFRRGLIEDTVVVRFESDADLFVHHCLLPLKNSWPPGAAALHLYSIMSVTVPAPTVRPPSRIAKRSPFSMAIGVISSTARLTLSPGITISVPSGNCATPVPSV